MSGCAVGQDGKLLEATEIEWFNDPDDAIPLSKPLTAASSHSSMQSMAPATLDSFFSRSGSPAVKIAGARRSQRVPRPSAKAAESSNRPGLKRKATDNQNQRSTTRRRVTSSGSDTSDKDTELDQDIEANDDAMDEDVDDDGVVDDASQDVVEEKGPDEEDNDAEDAYQTTKAMGDLDRQVTVGFVVSWCLLTFSFPETWKTGSDER